MTDLQKKRDEICESWADRFFSRTCGTHDNDRWVMTVMSGKNAWDAAIDLLAKQSVEFDEVAAIQELNRLYKELPKMSHGFITARLIEWQHQQTAAIFEAKLAVAREALENECWCGDNEGEFVKCVPCEALEKLGGG